jgi:phosphotriesterase-related protein
VELVKAGYASQIVLSNEIAWKISLRKYGGYGYAHVLENIGPDLRFYGVTEEQLNTMLVENPKRLLSF